MSSRSAWSRSIGSGAGSAFGWPRIPRSPARAARSSRRWCPQTAVRRVASAAIAVDATVGATVARVIVTVMVDACGTAIPTVRAPDGPVDQQHRLTTLESGVRILTEEMPSVRSVSVGFWIATGSRYERQGVHRELDLLQHSIGDLSLEAD